MSKLHRGKAPDPKNVRVGVKLSESEYKNFQRAAVLLNCSMSEVMREGARRLVKNMKRAGHWSESEDE